MILLALLATLHAAPERVAPPINDLEMGAGPTIQQFELSGGGKVWMLERRDFPLVGVEISVSWNGSIAGPQKRLGARLASMLMDSGSALERPESRQLDRMGVRWSAGIDDSHLWAQFVAPSGREEEALKSLTDLIRAPRLQKRELKRRRAWWADWRDQLAYDLDRTHERLVNHGLYLGAHSWRQMVQGTDLRRISLRTARSMPKHILENGQLHIAVVGDVAPEDILPALEAYLGELSGREQTLRSETPDRSRGLHLVDQEGFGVARISAVFPIPGRDDAKHFVAEALARIVAGRETSRLDIALREESGLSYSIETEIVPAADWGWMRFDTEVLPENVGEVLRQMKHLFKDLRESGIEESEFEAIRRGLVLESAQGLDLTQEATERLGELQRRQQGPDSHHAQAVAYSLLQASQLSELAQDVFQEGEGSWFVTGDANIIRDQLDPEQWDLVTDTDAESLSNSP